MNSGLLVSGDNTGVGYVDTGMDAINASLRACCWSAYTSLRLRRGIVRPRGRRGNRECAVVSPTRWSLA